MTETRTTRYEIRDQAAWITLDRPENRNALSADLVNEVHALLEDANQTPEVRVIVITGNGKAFCAGADLNNPPGQSVASKMAVTMEQLFAAIRDSAKPVIAAVNGPAFGGGLGIVAAADISIAAQEAIFSFSEVRLGVIPAIISVVCIPKMGKHQAMRLFLNGERFDGNRAVELNLAHLAVPADQLQQTVDEEIANICKGGPLAISECKKLVHQVPEMEPSEAFVLAAQWSRRMFGSEEAAEGMSAFREKRKPRWLK